MWSGVLVKEVFVIRFFVFLFFSGSNKQEEAAELLAKAANTYKMAKKWAGSYKTTKIMGI